MGVLYARETPQDNFTPVSTMGVGNASQSQRGLMTAQDKVKLDGIDDEKLDGIADYIVDEGTDGIWTYRKWNSGVAECWGTQIIHPNLSHAYGSVYIDTNGATTLTFPNGLFNNVPTVTTGIDLSGGVGGVTVQGLNSADFKIYVYNAIAFDASARNIPFMAHAIGTWK